MKLLKNPFSKSKKLDVMLSPLLSTTGKSVLSKVKHLDILLNHFLILLYSAYVKNEDALSGLLYAWQERGKSTVVLSVKHVGLLLEDDISSYGLSRRLNELQKEGKLKKIHHLLLPDLEKITSRSRTVKNELRSFLQSLMFDGIQDIDTYNIHIHFKDRMKLAVIACVTPDVFNEKSSFRRLGFLSRLIPFSFDYKNDVIDEIIKFIGTIEEDNLRVQTLKILEKKKAIISVPDEYMIQLEDKAKELASIIDNFVPYKEMFVDRLIGSRAKKMLVCYLKSICLINGDNKRLTVNEDDWKEFLFMYQYFNFDMNELPKGD